MEQATIYDKKNLVQFVICLSQRIRPRLLDRNRPRREGNYEVGLREVGWENMDLSWLNEDKVKSTK